MNELVVLVLIGLRIQILVIKSLKSLDVIVTFI